MNEEVDFGALAVQELRVLSFESDFVILLRVMPDNFVHQGRRLGLERVKYKHKLFNSTQLLFFVKE